MFLRLNLKVGFFVIDFNTEFASRRKEDGWKVGRAPSLLLVTFESIKCMGLVCELQAREFFVMRLREKSSLFLAPSA